MLVRGTLVHLPSTGELDILRDYLLAVDESGHIVHLAPAASEESKICLSNSAIAPTVIPQGSFLLPTFCDLHLHAPQFLYQGTGLHLPLMQWLDEYAFQAEERLDADLSLARRVYERLAERLIEHGTGAVLLFGTIKEETNLVLAEVMQAAGIRAFVGKLSMDKSTRPSYVESSTAHALSSATSFVHRCRDLVAHLEPHRRLVEPVLTPRFVPTCTDELLSGLGQLSESESLMIQSHLAEAHDQVDWVRRERGIDDIHVFDRSNLLTPRTIQAHCTFLDSRSLSHLVSRGTSIAHCPLSNAYFSAEPFRLREAIRQGVKVGLGTDIAGGYSIDIMHSMRHAVSVSRMREGQRLLSDKRTKETPDRDNDEDKTQYENLSIDWKESLYLATRGGASAVGLNIGVFQVGARFDAQHIQVSDPTTGSGIGPLDFFDFNESGSSHSGKTITLDVVEKWWCLGDVQNRRGMWVQGNRLAGAR